MNGVREVFSVVMRSSYTHKLSLLSGNTDFCFCNQLVYPDHLRLPQLVPPCITLSWGGPGLGLGLGLEARAILISTYASHTNPGRTINGGRPPMVLQCLCVCYCTIKYFSGFVHVLYVYMYIIIIVM